MNGEKKSTTGTLKKQVTVLTGMKSLPSRNPGNRRPRKREKVGTRREKMVACRTILRNIYHQEGGGREKGKMRATSRRCREGGKRRGELIQSAYPVMQERGTSRRKHLPKREEKKKDR